MLEKHDNTEGSNSNQVDLQEQDTVEDELSTIEFSIQDDFGENLMNNLHEKPAMTSSSSQTNVVKLKDKGIQTTTTYYRSKIIQANVKVRGINIKTQTRYSSFQSNKSVQTSCESGKFFSVCFYILIKVLFSLLTKKLPFHLIQLRFT